MKDMKIGMRLAAGFGVVIVLMLIIVGIGVLSMSRLDDHVGDMTNDKFPKVEKASDMIEKINDIARAMRNIVIINKPDDTQAEIRNIDEARASIKDDLAFLERTILTEQGKALLARVKAARAGYIGMQDSFKQLVAQGRVDEAKIYLVETMRIPQREYILKVADLIRFQDELVSKSGEEAISTYVKARNLMLGIGLAALIFAVALARYMTRSITLPIDDAVRSAHAIATGDLTRRIDVTSKDETGQLMQAMKDMNASLASIVGQVHAGTETIAVASRQIASGNADLSGRTESQASSLGETASSMEELTSTVKQNAENARQASQLVSSAAEIATKGGHVVNEVVETMASIKDSSRKIADIIGVIDGIAFQTNILALNAAVEAARAGEQGRGFAVVASEVRSLAQRSAGAAKEIKALIEDSVGKVDEGGRLVDEAGHTMDEIVTSVKRVTDIMSEIAAASHEQSAGIEQVNQAVGQMDEMTQQNAALVEEAAAAAESLREQAARLAEAVSVFRVGGAGQAAATSLNDRVRKPARNAPPAAKPAATVKQVKRVASIGGADEWEEF